MIPSHDLSGGIKPDSLGVSAPLIEVAIDLINELVDSELEIAERDRSGVIITQCPSAAHGQRWTPRHATSCRSG
jgi:hypothetical protein